MANRPELSYCADLVRRDDHDRFLTALFAPAGSREDLLALYAFNLEVARTREMVREPMMGMIRLQWWRESIDGIYAGTVRHHAVVQPLAAAVDRHDLSRAHFDRLLGAREADMEDAPPATLSALLDYTEGTSSSLVLLALELLSGHREADGEGREEPARAAGRDIGVAWALVGLLRAIPFHARAKRLYLPEDLTARAGLQTADVFEFRPSPQLAEIVRDVAQLAHTYLGKARKQRREVPRRLLPALLPAVLADLYLRNLEKAGYNVFDGRVQEAPPGRAWRLAFSALRGRY
jgi:NADH dehydrogenase [ubiquinone] 1 alpha subcomplex assembly factor 6